MFFIIRQKKTLIWMVFFPKIPRHLRTKNHHRHRNISKYNLFCNIPIVFKMIHNFILLPSNEFIKLHTCNPHQNKNILPQTSEKHRFSPSKLASSKHKPHMHRLSANLPFFTHRFNTCEGEKQLLNQCKQDNPGV